MTVSNICARRKTALAACLVVALAFAALALCAVAAPAFAATYSPAEESVGKVDNLKATASYSKRTIKLIWSKATDVDGYVVQLYKSGKYKKVKTINKRSKVTYTVKKVKRNKTYKYRVVAYRKLNGKTYYGVPSEYASTRATLKRASITKIKLGKTTVKIAAGKSYKEKTKVSKNRGRKLMDSKLRWVTSDPSVATVNSNGKILAKGAGTCTVTCLAHNGTKASATVRVPASASRAATSIPVLTYHRVVPDSAKSSLFVSDATVIGLTKFTKQMKWLHDAGYKTLTMNDFYAWYQGDSSFNEKSVLVVFDDGLYETYYNAYPVLKKYGINATSFLIGRKIKGTTPAYDASSSAKHYMGLDKIEEVKAEYPGLEFHSHSFDMHHRIGNLGAVYGMTRAQIDADFTSNEKYHFECIAYPFGHVTDDLVAAANAYDTVKLGFGYRPFRRATRSDSPYFISRIRVEPGETLAAFKRLCGTF